MTIYKFAFKSSKNDLKWYFWISLNLIVLLFILTRTPTLNQIAATFAVYPLAIFTHELGHYLMAKFVGRYVCKFEIGLSWGCVWTWIPEYLPIDLFHVYLIVIAGGLANLIAALMCFSWCALHGDAILVFMLALAQIKVTIYSLLPLKAFGPEQDGNRMMAVLDFAGKHGRIIHNAIH